MSAYVPEFVYSFTGWDENNQPTHGLVQWPEHLKPREPSPDIALTKKGEAYVAAALAEADGVFFLTIDSKDRQSIATSIEKLINMLDALEVDPDLEECGDQEPSLGWPDRGPCQVASPEAFERLGGVGPLHDDREADDCDAEDGADDEPEETDHNGDEGDYGGECDASIPIPGGGSVSQTEDGWKPAPGASRPAVYVEHAEVLPNGDIAREIIDKRDKAHSDKAEYQRAAGGGVRFFRDRRRGAVHARGGFFTPGRPTPDRGQPAGRHSGNNKSPPWKQRS